MNLELSQVLTFFMSDFAFQDIPPEYFMKNRLPLIKRVRQVNKEIKKLAKIEEEVYVG